MLEKNSKLLSYFSLFLFCRIVLYSFLLLIFNTSDVYFFKDSNLYIYIFIFYNRERLNISFKSTNRRMSTEKKVILVTGGTGLVGSAIRRVAEETKNDNETFIFLSSKDVDLTFDTFEIFILSFCYLYKPL